MLNGLIYMVIQRWLGLLLTWGMEIPSLFYGKIFCRYLPNTNHKRWLKRSLLTRGDHIYKKSINLYYYQTFNIHTHSLYFRMFKICLCFRHQLPLRIYLLILSLSLSLSLMLESLSLFQTFYVCLKVSIHQYEHVLNTWQLNILASI